MHNRDGVMGFWPPCLTHWPHLMTVKTKAIFIRRGGRVKWNNALHIVKKHVIPLPHLQQENKNNYLNKFNTHTLTHTYAHVLYIYISHTRVYIVAMQYDGTLSHYNEGFCSSNCDCYLTAPCCTKYTPLHGNGIP